ncbi:unnamed protein product, partial [Iphiclides podalirius]
MFRLLIAAFFAAVSANVIVDGPCPDVKPLENFNFHDYQGTWYEIAKFPNSGEDGRRGKCTTAEYTVDGEKGKVKNSQVVDGVKTYVAGDISLAAPGKILITYKFGAYTKNSILTILDTDYNNYAIGYSCKFLENENKHQVFSWIISRNQSLGDAKSKVDDYLKNNDAIDTSKYVYNEYTEEACKFTSVRAITEIHRGRH